MIQRIARTAEHVSEGHPDKFCDQVADRILDAVLDGAARQDRDEQPSSADASAVASVRTAIECLVKDNLVIVSGEVKLTPRIRAELDVIALAREVWRDVGYGDVWSGGFGDEDAEQVSGELTVINHIRTQSKNIGTGDQSRTESETGVNLGGAGDQGIMVGYATDETPELMPKEWVMARDLCRQLRDLRKNGTLTWLRSDCKTQVTLDPDGGVQSVIIAAQHAPQATEKVMGQELRQYAIAPVLGTNVPDVRINGTGRFVVGGPTGDAGVVGRKIVIDAYGPRVAVGGGAYSGKDPTKVDRSAAYMCRHIAKAVVANRIEGARQCTVSLAYGIGQHRPEMFTVVTENGTDIAGKVMDALGLKETSGRSPLSPRAIIERLGLRERKEWTYYQTASYGHYGREEFPWERPFAG